MMPDYSDKWAVKKLLASECWTIVYMASTEKDANSFATYLRLKGETVLVEPPQANG